MEMNKAALVFEAYFEKTYPKDSVIDDPRRHAPKIFKAAALSMIAGSEIPEEPDVVKTLRGFGENSETIKIVRYIDALSAKIILLQVENEKLKVHDV